MRAWYHERLVLSAALACVATGTMLAISFQFALKARGQERARAPQSGGAMRGSLDQPLLPKGVLTETLEHDPFHPARRRPSVAFAPPGASERLKPVVAPITPAMTVRLLGTVVSTTSDAFVMAQVGADPPRVVRIGAKIGGFTLRKIEPGRAVFLSPDGEMVDLRVSKSGP